MLSTVGEGELIQLNHKLATYGTDGQLFTTDVSAKFKVTLHKN